MVFVNSALKKGGKKMPKQTYWIELGVKKGDSKNALIDTIKYQEYMKNNPKFDASKPEDPKTNPKQILNMAREELKLFVKWLGETGVTEDSLRPDQLVDVYRAFRLLGEGDIMYTFLAQFTIDVKPTSPTIYEKL